MAAFHWLDDAETVSLPPFEQWFAPRSPETMDIVLGILEKQTHFILVEASARKAAIDHVTGVHVEQAGLLIGKAYERKLTGDGAQERARYIVHITDAIAAHDGEATPVSVKIPPSTWGLARPYLDDGKLVVGWYHSHPNIGAFFSGTDRKTQASLFYHPYSVGWVIDWVRTEEATFVGANAQPSGHDVASHRDQPFQ